MSTRSGLGARALPRKRRFLAVLATLVALTGLALVLSPTAASAQTQGTGATATKDCPSATVGDPYTIGDTVPCTSVLTNQGVFTATIASLTETAPFIATGNAGNGAPIDLTCTLANGTVLDEGDTLAAGQSCTASFNVVIPNNPALCNTVFRDRVDIALSYPQFTPPLEAGAFATNIVLVVCAPTITVTKTADGLSKIGDPVNYTITVCNTSPFTVTKDSVNDTLIPGVNAAFGATLAAGTAGTPTCEAENFTRTVVAGDPDPLVNTVTATYTAGTQEATQTATATTNLFQPSVDVTKSCAPDPIAVGTAELCAIVVTNTSSADSPALQNGTITDTLSGNLLMAGNTAVVNSTCTAVLAVGASCTINTTRTVLATDPSPLVNTVTVKYNPVGFPNAITDTASDQVVVEKVDITVTKTADGLSKIGDPVNYTITVCNTSPFTVTKDSVNDTLIPGVNAAFGATLAAGTAGTPTCEAENFTRTVVAGDPDPLVNTVTATYTGAAGSSDTATATATTNLFQPRVAVTKNCSPDPIQVGQSEVCTIVVTNTSSADTPTLINGTITDTLAGNLLLAGNPRVTSSNCTATLAVNGTCTIVTNRVVVAADPSPLVNTVTVTYNPTGFPNVIKATATDSVVIKQPPGGEGCTPGYWKQPQHLDSWVATGFKPGDSFEAVFGVDVTLGGFGNQPTLTAPTLIQALEQGGGGQNALARHAVAALLNAASPDVDSDFTTAQVIALVKDALTPGGLSLAEVQALLSESNEDGCPLN